MDSVKLPKFDLGASLKDYQEEMFSKLYADTDVVSYIKEIGASEEIVKKNLSKFIAYQEEHNYCKNCPGLDKCNKEGVHLSMSLVVEGKTVSRIFDNCEKYKERQRLEDFFIYRDFPTDWMGCSETKWLYLVGNTRVGKSYLSACFAFDYCELNEGKKAAFIDSTSFFKTLSDLSYSSKSQFDLLLDQLSAVYLLILDNFGDEYKSEYMRDTIVYPLVSSRAKNNLLTIFTSNFTLTDIKDMYSLKSKGNAIKANQLFSLLSTMCQREIEVQGSSSIY